jgi:hypothetical protein
MQVNLTPHAERLVRDALARNPNQTPEQIIESALQHIH